MYYTVKCTMCYGLLETILPAKGYKFTFDETDIYVGCPTMEVADIVEDLERARVKYHEVARDLRKAVMLGKEVAQ